MIISRQRIQHFINGNDKNSKRKIIAVVFAVFVCLIVTVEGVKSIAESQRINEIYETRGQISETFQKNKLNNKREPIRQDKSLEGLVLLNVADKDAADFESSDIRNIFVVIFEKNATRGYINIVGLQKKIIVGKNKKNDMITLQASFDKNDPARMYRAIEKMIDYKVGSYIAYDNSMIKKVMDQCSFLNGNIQYAEQYKMDDKKEINKTIPSYAKDYGINYYDLIKNPGIQPLDPVQMLAYVNMYKDVPNCCWNDWRQLAFLGAVFDNMKNGNISDLESIRKIVLDGENDISNDQLIKIGAVIGEYSIGAINRWPNMELPQIYKGKEYSTPLNLFECTKLLHKGQHKERGYKVSDKVKKYAKTIKGIEGYIAEYAKKQDAKKRTKEEEKLRKAMEALNKSNEAQKQMDKETGASKDKDKNSQKKSRTAAKKGSSTKSKSSSKKSGSKANSKKPSSKKPGSSKPSSKPANNNNDNDDGGGGETPAPEPDPPSEGTDPSPAPEDNNK